MSVHTSAEMPSVTPTTASRSNLTSSFSVTDNNDEVICPLPNTDGSICRKRCSGPKRFRSMQEHVRRAHAEYHIPKLPATEESIILMFTSAPRPKEATSAPSVQPPAAGRDYSQHYYSHGPATPRHVNGGSEARAALALTNLHEVKSEGESDVDVDEGRRYPHSSIETPLPPIQLPPYSTSHPFPSANHPRQRDLLPSLISNTSPPGRSSTLPPQHRGSAPKHSRKHSVTKQRHQGHHSKNSKGHAADALRRLGLQSNDSLRMNARPYSAEPGLERWESLLFVADAASSAADDLEGDRTPLPQSPMSVSRLSVTPSQPQPHRSQHHHSNEYQASPLQQNLTPPDLTSPPFPPPAELYPSLEPRADDVRMRGRDISDMSPPLRNGRNAQICCARCNHPSRLGESLACTECISGFCRPCVDLVHKEEGDRCPRCATVGARFKPFQLEFW